MQMEDSENYFLAVEILKKNKWIHIGNMSASVDFNNKIADLAIIIGDKSQWGKGYGSLAWCLTATALIEILNLRFVVAGTMSTNQPMLNIFKKTNMNIELKVKKYFLLDGNEIDLIIATGERRIFEKYLSKN